MYTEYKSGSFYPAEKSSSTNDETPLIEGEDDSALPRMTALLNKLRKKYGDSLTVTLENGTYHRLVEETFKGEILKVKFAYPKNDTEASKKRQEFYKYYAAHEDINIYELSHLSSRPSQNDLTTSEFLFLGDKDDSIRNFVEEYSIDYATLHDEVFPTNFLSGCTIS